MHGNLRTRKRTATETSCLVSAPCCVCMPVCFRSSPAVPGSRMLGFEKFNFDSSVLTLTSCCPSLLSDDDTRVVLLGKEDYINASHITVNITHLKLPPISFSVNSSCSSCVGVCVSLRWHPLSLECVYVTLQLKVHFHRPALTFGKLYGSNRRTPSSCLQL